jgi:hypothetical protein
MTLGRLVGMLDGVVTASLPDVLVGTEVATTMLDCGVRAVALSYPVGLILIVWGIELELVKMAGVIVALDEVVDGAEMTAGVSVMEAEVVVVLEVSVGVVIMAVPLVVSAVVISLVAEVVGEVVGPSVGEVVGEVVGPSVGEVVGEVVGPSVGEVVGEVVGPSVGDVVGPSVGDVVRASVSEVVAASVGVVVAAAAEATDSAELTTEFTDDTTDAAEDKACEIEAASVEDAVEATDSRELATDNTDEATLAADERSELTDDVMALASVAAELVTLARSEEDVVGAVESVLDGTEVSVLDGTEVSVVEAVVEAKVSVGDVAEPDEVVVTPRTVFTRLDTSDAKVEVRLAGVDRAELESVVGAVVSTEVAAGVAELDPEPEVVESVVVGSPTRVVAVEVSVDEGELVSDEEVLVEETPVNKLTEMMDSARSLDEVSCRVSKPLAVVFKNGVTCLFTTRGK